MSEEFKIEKNVTVILAFELRLDFVILCWVLPVKWAIIIHTLKTIELVRTK